jgi:hypothetical protein
MVFTLTNEPNKFGKDIKNIKRKKAYLAILLI